MSQEKSFTQIRDEHLRAGSIFEDRSFPSNNKSLYMPGGDKKRYEDVKWRRPYELTNNPVFILDGASRHDLDQGELGDCWFVAGAAILATDHRKQLDRVMPRDQGFDRNYAGIFHFNFWWYGDFKEVIIDDYLPTVGNRLIFSSNRHQANEFWPALLEKAYAKLRGSYEALHGGFLTDVLVDFTGGLPERIETTGQDPKIIYELLCRSYKMNSVLGGSINRPPGTTESEIKMKNGLYKGHAYSITGFYRLNFNGRECRLLRVRNPWGEGEWNGPWSDYSREMASVPRNIKQKLDFRTRKDGEFWISIEDFLANFDDIHLCHLVPDALTDEIALDMDKEHWYVTLYHDTWIRDVTAGGSGQPPNQDLFWKNPQFFVTLHETDERLAPNKCTLIVSLMEAEFGGDFDKASIAFHVYKLEAADYRLLDRRRALDNAHRVMVYPDKYVFLREAVWRMELSPGHYVIIPSTFYPYVERDFLLRLFTEKYAESGLLNKSGIKEVLTEKIPTPSRPLHKPEDRVTKVFRKHAGKDGKMDAGELRKFIRSFSKADCGEELDFNHEVCRSLVTMTDKNQTGFLTKDEAEELWKNVKTYVDVFRQFDKDRSGGIDTFELSSLFSAIGFPINRSVQTAIVRRYGGRDNRISLEDFIIILSKLVVMYNIFAQQQKSQGQRDGIAKFTHNEFLQYTMFC